MSYSPMRWFCPPPIRTAYFSSIRYPGNVLRVSRMLTSVDWTRLTKARVIVATPERCCKKFSAIRSAASIDRAGPSTSATTVPGEIGSPSCTSARNCNAGSTWVKTASTTGSPAMTPSALANIQPRNVKSTGNTASEVASPGPRSSSIVRSING